MMEISWKHYAQNRGRVQKLPVDVKFIVSSAKEVSSEVAMVKHCWAFD